MRPGARRAMGETQGPTVRREAERPARVERMGRLDRAGLIKPLLQFRLGQRRQAKAARNETAGPHGIVRAAHDEFDLSFAPFRQRGFEAEARRRVEGPEFSLVVELPTTHRFAARRRGERTLANKTRTRVLVTDEFDARNRLDREERDFAAMRAGRAQQPVAREDGVEAAHEDGLYVHAGEVEIAGIGARIDAGNFAKTGQAEPAPLAGEIGETDAPTQDGAFRVRRDFHRRANAVEYVGYLDAVEAGLGDGIFACATGRLIADRPGGSAVFAQIEKRAARLLRIDRPADEIDRTAAAFVAQHHRRAAPVAPDFDADSAVVERQPLRLLHQCDRRAREPRTGRSALLAQSRNDERARGDDARPRDGVRDRQRLDRPRHRAAVRKRLGARPGLVPICPTGDVERDKQLRPGAETANPVWNRARSRAVTQKSPRRFVGAIAEI